MYDKIILSVVYAKTARDMQPNKDKGIYTKKVPVTMSVKESKGSKREPKRGNRALNPLRKNGEY